MIKFVYLVLYLVLPGSLSYTGSRSRSGNALYWQEQPPSKLWFMIEIGAMLPCRSRGSPPPSISWFTDDGIPVLSHSGVREILPNGSLYFPPNLRNVMSSPSDQATTYFCHASNIVGTLVSKNVQVRAVTNHQWQVRVYDQYVLDGNSAVMSCEVPPFVKDFVSVTSWAQGSKNIYPGQDKGNRVQMVSTGQLVVHNVSAKDHQMAVRCRAVHTLTGETREAANAAHIYVTDSRNNVVPTISELRPEIIVRKGSSADLLCPAYGYPPPEITWLRKSKSMGFGGFYATSGTMQNHAQTNSGDLIVGQGPVLSFNTVEEAHAGTYTCSANNSLGVAFHRIRLEVTSALSVQMTPSEIKVPAGGVATMECSVSGAPIKSIHWLKDGISLPRSGRTRNENGGRLMKVLSVRANDEGIYQCKVDGENDSAVGAVLLTLGDTPPVLIYRFIEQTMQPGPAASVKCIASGRPTPSIKWTLDGFSISNMDRLVRGQFVRIGGDVVSHVNVSNVSPLDGGLYTCTATNAVGTISHSARLNVYGLPVVRPMGKIDAIAGETLALHCPVGGFPINSISWKKGGKSLPLNRRQQVFSNGSLIISNIQSLTDGGSYECTAFTRMGEQSTQSVAVNVVVPPRILPFKSNHELREATRLIITCALTEGDLPLTFEWFWNGRPLQPEHRDSIHKIGDFSSYLIILSVQRHHAGNYTCKVSNVAGSVTKTATIHVQVPPRWELEPTDITALVGETLILPCQADGFPQPEISWKRAKLYDSGSFEDLQGGILGLKPLSNGSLVLSQVTKRFKGKYLCEATNGIGPGLSKVVEVSVQAPPHFNDKDLNISFGIGSEATIECKVTGDFPINISWRKNGMIIQARNSYR